MGRAKATIGLEGFDELIQRIKKLDGDVKSVSEEALKKSKRLVHTQIGEAMQPHNRTYQTIKSLDKESTVNWVGSTASIDVGFNISNGGLPSIFLMYGTPKMTKDTKLYNAIYGKKTREAITDLQSDILYDAIRGLE